MARPLSEVDPDIDRLIRKETDRQNGQLELIASENFTSEAILEATGSVLTNKYAEGYPGKRYYGGCEFVDEVENIARDRAKKLFGAEYANVQPHSGSQANQAAFASILQPGDTIMGLDLAHGGHLTHGHKLNFSGKTYHVVGYQVSKEDERVDFEHVARLADEHKPKMIIAGGSAYPRQWDFAKFRQIADSVGASLVVDMAHFSGLVAAGLHPNPCEYADIVTSTTHKTLARSALRPDSGARKVRRGNRQERVPRRAGRAPDACGGRQGGLFPRSMQPCVSGLSGAGDRECPSALATGMRAEGFRVVSGGTDTHLLLLDVFSKGVRGREAENALDAARITVNKNAIPFDVQSADESERHPAGQPGRHNARLSREGNAGGGSCIAEVLRKSDSEEILLTFARVWRH